MTLDRITAGIEAARATKEDVETKEISDSRGEPDSFLLGWLSLQYNALPKIAEQPGARD
jgi:hypothetical protein